MKNDNTRKKEPLKKSRTNAKIKDNFQKTYENLANVSNPCKKKIIINSNNKYSMNSKPFKDIKLANILEKKPQPKFCNKIINNTINEDKDLESLLSELKTTFQPPNTPYENSEKKNYEYEYVKLFNNDKMKDNNNNMDFIDLHFDLDDQGQGHDISQRVHTRHAKKHFDLADKKEKEKDIDKDKDTNKIVNPKKIISLNFIKKIKNSLGKEQIPGRKNSDSSSYNIINNTSFNKNKKKRNLIKYKTSRNNLINDTQIKFDDVGKIKKVIKFKKSPNKKFTNYFKMYKNSIVNSIGIPNKALISTPKNYTINKTLRLDNIKNTIGNRNSHFNKKKNNSKKIGELYIKNTSTNTNKHKNYSKMVNIKRNNTSYLNPFDNNSFINDKFVRKNNSRYHFNSFAGKIKSKNSFDYKKSQILK